MPTDFHTAAGNPTTTARELANELSRFAADLKETADELRGEIDHIKQARGDINEELEATARKFVENTLTDLKGNDFDAIADTAQHVEELGSQGLAYFRANLVDRRDSALAQVNETLGQTIDASEFLNMVENVEGQYEDVREEYRAADQKLNAAKSALKDWTDNTVEDDLIILDQKIRKEGGVTLTSDNRDYYNANIFVATLRYVTDSTYRNARHALEEYGQGDFGRDAFADLENFKGKFDTFNNDIETAQAEFETVSLKREEVSGTLASLESVASIIKTDAQILSEVQEKVIADITNSPEFIKAIAEHYDEDFPRNLPLLIAKKNTLTKLETGTNDKLDAVLGQFSDVSKQYREMSKVSPNRKVKADLDKIKRRNKARNNEYKRYKRAANDSWRRTRDYDWDYDRNRTIYVDRGPGFLETLIIYNILTDDDHHYDDIPAHDDFYADDDSSFSADLMGVDDEYGDEIGLPGSTFELSDEVTAEMADLGFDDYEPGSTFDLDAPEDSFEFDDYEPEPEPSYDAGDSFSLDDDNDSGFGGSSNDDDYSSTSSGGSGFSTMDYS